MAASHAGSRTDPRVNPLAQKSLNIPPPVKDLGNSLSGISTAPFTDHSGQRAISVFWGKRAQANAPILPPQWSFQFYITSGATAESSPTLPEQLLTITRSSGLGTYPVRLDINFIPGADTNQCMEHYRAEQAARQSSGAPLKLIDPYTEDRSHMKLLVQIEAANWNEAGATVAFFDQTSDYDDDDEPPRINIMRGVPWSGSDETVGKLLHSMAAGTGQDELNDEYHERLEAGRSDWS